MLHQPFQTDSAPPKRQAPAKRQRRLFGWREVLLVVRDCRLPAVGAIAQFCPMGVERAKQTVDQGFARRCR